MKKKIKKEKPKPEVQPVDLGAVMKKIIAAGKPPNKKAKN